MSTSSKTLSAHGGLVGIGQAAAMLGVSIDTVRRWDKTGVLHSIRLDGKTRYFDVASLERQRVAKPRKVSEAARMLDVSPSTLRRLENRGIIKAKRRKNGERLYDRIAVERLIAAGRAAAEWVNTAHIPLPIERFANGESHSQPQGQLHLPARSILNRDYGDTVFTWFIAILAIFSGISQFLFPGYTQSISFKPYLGALIAVKTLLMVAGVLYLWSRISEGRLAVFARAANLSVAFLFGVQAYIFFATNNPINGVASAVITWAVLSALVFKANEFIRFMATIVLWGMGVGVVFLMRPGTAPSVLLTGYIADNAVTFAAVWFGSLAILATLVYYGRALKKEVYVSSAAYAVSIGSFAYVTFAVAHNLWDQAVLGVVVGVFAVLFNFEHKFSSIRVGQKTGIYRSFAVFLTVILIGAGAVYYLQASFKNYVLTQNTQSLQTAESIVNTNVSDTSRTISGFAKNQQLQALLAQDVKDPAAYDSLMRDLFLTSATLRKVGLIDGNGKAITLYPQDPTFPGLDLSDRNYFVQARDTGQLAISDGIVPRTNSAPVAVVFAAPLTDRSGRFLGEIFGSMDLVQLSGRLQDLSGSEDGSIVVADRSGMVIMHEDDKYLLAKAGSEGALAEGLKGETGHLEGYDETGRRNQQSYAPIDELGWSMVAQQPLSEVAAHNSSTSFVVFLAAMLIGIGSLVVGDKPTRWLGSTRKPAKRPSSHREAGFVPVIIILATMLLVVAILGGSSVVGKFGQGSQSRQQSQSTLDESAALLDADKLNDAELTGPIIGTATLADGSFSQFDVIDAQIVDGRLVGEPRLEFQNGDVFVGNPGSGGRITNFKLKDGSTATAYIQEAAAVNMRLASGEDIPVKVWEGTIIAGKLLDATKLQTYTTRHTMVAQASRSGTLSNVTVEAGGIRLSDLTIFVVQRFLYDDPKASQASDVLGTDSESGGLTNDINEVYTSGLSNTSLATELVYDREKGTISSRALNDVASANERLTIVRNGSIAVLSLNLNDLTGEQITDGSIETVDLADGLITQDKLAPGIVLNSPVTSSTGDIEEVVAGSGLTGGGTSGSVTLNVTSSNGGIAVGADQIALTVQVTGDGLSSTISSGSGLEILSGGITLLQGCANNEILKWNEGTDIWACSADSTGGGGANSFETIAVPNASNPVADSATDTLNLTVTGTNLTITGTAGTDTIDFNVVETVLAGNGLVVTGDALDVAAGNGIQLTSDAVALGALTGDWSQTGAFDIILNNADAQIQILESDGGASIGTLDVGSLSGNATYTFVGSSGNVLTDANYTVTLDSIYVNVGESPAAGDITGSFSGGLTVGPNAVALTTDTTGNYTATIADAGNSTILVINGVAEGGAVTLDVIDLNCTNCI